MAVPAGDILRPRACVVKEKLWKGRQVLKVFFMNPEVLEGWKCEGKKMTTEKIMEWAGAWKEASPAPEFTGTQRVDRADIRVKFSAAEACSSSVGMLAATIDRDQPTMVLNLTKKDDPEFMKCQVMEMFGHALGLEEESAGSPDSFYWDEGFKKLKEEYSK